MHLVESFAPIGPLAHWIQNCVSSSVKMRRNSHTRLGNAQNDLQRRNEGEEMVCLSLSSLLRCQRNRAQDPILARRRGFASPVSSPSMEVHHRSYIHLPGHDGKCRWSIDAKVGMMRRNVLRDAVRPWVCVSRATYRPHQTGYVRKGNHHRVNSTCPVLKV